MPFNAIVFPSDAHKTPKKNAKQTRKCALHFMYMRLSSNVMSYNNRRKQARKHEGDDWRWKVEKRKYDRSIIVSLHYIILLWSKWLRPKRSRANIESDDFLERIFIILMEVRLLFLIYLMLLEALTLFPMWKGFDAWKYLLCYFKLQAVRRR